MGKKTCTCPDLTQTFLAHSFKKDTVLSNGFLFPLLAKSTLLSVLWSLALNSVCESCRGARIFVCTRLWPMSSRVHPPTLAIYLGYSQVFFSLIFFFKARSLSCYTENTHPQTPAYLEEVSFEGLDGDLREGRVCCLVSKPLGMFSKQNILKSSEGGG